MGSSANDVFQKIVDKATERVAKKGWEGATQKEITLACFGLLSRQIKSEMNSFKRPCRWLAGVLSAGVFTYIIFNFFG